MIALRALRASALAAAMAVAGCSFVTVEPLGGSYRRETTPDCGASRVTVVGDIVLASLALIYTGVIVYIISEETPETTDALRQNHRVGLVEWGGATALFAASAVYGTWQARRCDAARSAHDQWLRERGAQRSPAHSSIAREIE